MSRWLQGFVWGVFVATLEFVTLSRLTGCYLEHAAEPCDDGGVPESGLSGSVANRVHSLGAAGSNPAPSTTYPGACPFAYDAAHCWCTDSAHEVCAYCAGPIVAGECYANLGDWLR